MKLLNTVFISVIAAFAGFVAGWNVKYLLETAKTTHVNLKSLTSDELKTVDGHIVDNQVTGRALEGDFIRVSGIVEHVVDKGGLPVVKIHDRIFCSLPMRYSGRVMGAIKVGARADFEGVVAQNNTVGILVKPAEPFGETVVLLSRGAGQ